MASRPLRPRRCQRKLCTVIDVTTSYARSGDVSIAYQVMGGGPFDIVWVPGFVTHIELEAKIPSFVPILAQLASVSRLIRFDKRGTGMSDRVSGAPTLETRMDDVRAVMDASGSARAALFGVSDGAAMSILFAATYPERTAALVLRSGYPRTMWASDYPWGRSEEDYRREVERDLRLFGPTDEAMEAVRSRMQIDDDDEVQQWVDCFRSSASPAAVEALALMNKEIDVRDVLSAIRVPTLIIHGTDDTVVPIEVARYMSERVPAARVVELPSTGHLATGRAAAAVGAEAKRFLHEVWEAGGWEETAPDRVLATVLFTDIVGSSEQAALLGDRAWRELLERHHEIVRQQLVRFLGREVDTAGDGFFASFDGPARAIRCAQAVVGGVSELGIEIRAGLHTGECEVIGGKVTGIAVHTGARVAAQARPGEVLVSSTVKDLVAGSGIGFEDRGPHELKGIPGEWRLFAVAGID
jgi:pimeloyl-ACP methyl ester carboxylesterase